MLRHTTCRILPNDANTTLLDFLTRRFNYLTRDAWLERIRAGRLRVNGLPAEPGLLLVAGAALCHDTSDIPEPPVDTRIKILHDTPDFLVINKSGNLPIHPAGRYFNNTLWALLKRDYNIPNPLFINRLDRETSGVVLIAKTHESARRAGLAMMRHQIAKTYLALVFGWPEQDEWECREPIIRRGEVEESPVYLERTVHILGASAHTRSRVVSRETCERGRYACVQAEPLTGRTHQIRVHLAHAGYPVIGDKIYARGSQHYLDFIAHGWTHRHAETLWLPRHALHCCQMQMEEFCWQSPLPLDMRIMNSE